MDVGGLEHQIAKLGVFFEDGILPDQFAPLFIGFDNVFGSEACGHRRESRIEIFALLDFSHDTLLVFFDASDTKFVLGAFLGADVARVSDQFHLLVHRGDERFSILDSGCVVGFGDELFGDSQQHIGDLDAHVGHACFIDHFGELFLGGFEADGWIGIFFRGFSDFGQDRFDFGGAGVFVGGKSCREEFVLFGGAFVVAVFVEVLGDLPTLLGVALGEPNVERHQEGQQEQNDKAHADDAEGFPGAFFGFVFHYGCFGNRDTRKAVIEQSTG